MLGYPTSLPSAPPEADEFPVSPVPHLPAPSWRVRYSNMYTVTLSTHAKQQNPILHLHPTVGHLNSSIHSLNVNPTCRISIHTCALWDVLGYQRHGTECHNTRLEGDLCPPRAAPKCPLGCLGVSNSTQLLFVDKRIKPVSVSRLFQCI